MRAVVTAGAACLLLSSVLASSAWAQCKQPQKLRVDQENYQLLTDKAYAYVEDINSEGTTGWGAFKVRILYGQYGNPFTLTKGFMRSGDVDKTIARRKDVSVQLIEVPAYDPKKSSQKNFGRTVSIKLSGNKTLTVRVSDVQPVRGIGRTDYLFLEVCGPA